MNIQQLLQSMAERVSASASVKSVFGDPVVAGNRTVILAARVRYAFGGTGILACVGFPRYAFGSGGGHPKGEAETPGGGGGAHVSARPCGVVEVTPESTRFIAFEDRGRMGAALAIGFVLGAALVALTGTRRIEVVKRAE